MTVILGLHGSDSKGKSPTVIRTNREGLPMAQKPTTQLPPSDWGHHQLWTRVPEAIKALPGYFKSPTNIEGMLGADIFPLNAGLSATIEEQVVPTLNEMRSLWDPDRKY